MVHCAPKFSIVLLFFNARDTYLRNFLATTCTDSDLEQAREITIGHKYVVYENEAFVTGVWPDTNVHVKDSIIAHSQNITILSAVCCGLHTVFKS